MDEIASSRNPPKRLREVVQCCLPSAVGIPRLRAWEDVKNSSNTNHVKSATYLDLVAEYRFDVSKGGELAVYGGVNNLLDTDPPRVPGANGTGNNLLFDPVGRNFKLGVRYKL